MEAHPYSERAIKKRRKDPRVIPALRAALDREDGLALATRSGRQPQYSENYAIVAKYLARLGDSKGIEGRENYRRYERWAKRQPM